MNESQVREQCTLYLKYHHYVDASVSTTGIRVEDKRILDLSLLHLLLTGWLRTSPDGLVCDLPYQDSRLRVQFKRVKLLVLYKAKLYPRIKQ